MSSPSTRQGLNAFLAYLDCNRERANERYKHIRQRLIRLVKQAGVELSQGSADEIMSRAANQLARSGLVLQNPDTYLVHVASCIVLEEFRQRVLEKAISKVEQPSTTLLADEPNLVVSPAPVSTQPTCHQNAPLENLRCHLQVLFPVLYAKVLEPTLADLREEHSDALAEGHPFKARRVLLQGYGALAAAAVCQLASSFRGRITALWQAGSPK